MEQTGWKWWAGRDEERYTEGPFECREIAISEGRTAFGSDVGFYILEAVQENPIDFARFMNAEDVLMRLCENIDENCADPDGDSLTEDAWTTEQEKDLEAMLQETVRNWQVKHNIKIASWLFQAQRNQEKIEPLPQDTEAGCSS